MIHSAFIVCLSINSLMFVFLLSEGRQVGQGSLCREKLEKTIILYTKVVSQKRPNSVKGAKKIYSTLKLEMLSVSRLPLRPLLAAGFPGISPVAFHTSHSALAGVRRWLRVHRGRGGGRFRALYCAVHEPHQDDRQKWCLQTCQEHWGWRFNEWSDIMNITMCNYHA